MHSQDNPFQAPAARVADAIPGAGDFVPEGQRVPAGHGISWLGRGWELFREAPGTWIAISVIFFVILLVLSKTPGVKYLVSLAMPVFMGGILIGCKALEEGEELRIGHLFAGFSGGHVGKLLLVGVIYLIGMVAAIFAIALLAGGMGVVMRDAGQIFSAAILLPALVGMALIVFLAMAVWYAPALVVFHEVPPFQAMKASFFTCLKNFLPFLVYGVVFLILAALATLPVLLGWLVLIPVTYGSIYAGYRDMFTRS